MHIDHSHVAYVRYNYLFWKIPANICHMYKCVRFGWFVHLIFEDLEAKRNGIERKIDKFFCSDSSLQLNYQIFGGEITFGSILLSLSSSSSSSSWSPKASKSPSFLSSFIGTSILTFKFFSISSIEWSA